MSERLNLLKPLLDQYHRRFHVLDIGGGIESSQNVGQEIARTYDAVCTTFEKDWTRSTFVPSPRTIVFKHELTVGDMEVFATCEHFDVMLMLNVLHWYESEWKRTLDCALSMCDWLIVQLPSRMDSFNPSCPGRDHVVEMHEYINSLDVPRELLGETVQFEGHAPRPMFKIRGRNYRVRNLTRTHVDANVGWANTNVHSTYHQLWGWMQDKRKWVSPWMPGMNLYNFCRWGGVWPSADVVDYQLSQVLVARGERNDGHGDVNVHNVVMDGEVCTLVDGHEGWESDDEVEMGKVRTKVRGMLNA